jgi:hypothetical protein
MRRSLLLLPLLVAACGGSAPPDAGTGHLYIGTAVGMGTDPAALTYAPLEDNTELTLEPGAQGGFHVYLHLRVDEFAIADMGDRPLLQRWARRVDTNDLVSRAKRTHAFVPSDEPGILEVDRPIPLFLCPTLIDIAVANEPLELEIELSKDEMSPPLKANIRFTPRCPEGDQKQFCRNICFG